MERKRTTSVKAAEVKATEAKATGAKVAAVPIATADAEPIAEVISMAQIQGLVRLLDRSDISELEVKRASEGVHLVLRKVKAQDGAILAGEVVSAVAGESGEAAGAANRQTVVAPLVGLFHPWLKPRGGTLVAIGDRVKPGQLVGTIESLNVLNEIETVVAGRVLEIHVQDGQPVEYGQVLVTIEIVEAEEA